jgi:hypothetical protein
MAQARARERVKNIVLTQISAAGPSSLGQSGHGAGAGTRLNEAIDGDAAARKLFWSLLYPHQQRDLFLELYHDRRFWPRIKPLVGSPPFSFLRPEEAQMLNAGAIRSDRRNMAHDDANSTSSASEIGEGHFVDGSGRKIRIVDRSDRTSGVLPFARLRKGVRVVLDLKVSRMANSERLAIAKKRTSGMDKISFPKVNEVVRFAPTRLVEAELSSSRASEKETEERGERGEKGENAGDTEENSGSSSYGIELQIKGVVQRGVKSPVCRVFAVVT